MYGRSLMMGPDDELRAASMGRKKKAASPPRTLRSVSMGRKKKPAASIGRRLERGDTIPVHAYPDTAFGDVYEPDPGFRSRVDSTVNAPFVRDTLFPSVGGPPKRLNAHGGNMRIERGGEIGAQVGYYAPDTEEIGVRPIARHMNGRGDGIENVLVHEAGHLLEDRTDGLAGLLDPLPLARKVHHRWKRKDTDVPLPDDYDEYFAQLFSTTTNLLRRTKDYSPEVMRTIVDRFDEKYPGAKDIVEHLVKTGPFGAHPAGDR